MRNAYGFRCLAAAALALSIAGSANATDLRIAMRDDPDVLDPTLATTYTGRIVFAGLATNCSISISTWPSCRNSPPATNGAIRRR